MLNKNTPLTSQEILNYVRNAKKEHFKNDQYLKHLTHVLRTKNDFKLTCYLKKNVFNQNKKVS